MTVSGSKVAQGRSTKKEFSTNFQKADVPDAPVAEPQHRIGPLGVSSGVSLRQYPTNYIQQVREICLHYVKKCSGKYENNKAAARYVHQMSRYLLIKTLYINLYYYHYYSEILLQLAGVAAQVNRFENEPELYQSLLDEWNENFPPSLGASGTPKAVAAILSKQSTQLIDLKEQIQAEQKRREVEVAEVMRSMDVQLSISRKCVVVERKQLAVSHQLEKERLEQLIAEADTKLNNVVDAIKEVLLLLLPLLPLLILILLS